MCVARRHRALWHHRRQYTGKRPHARDKPSAKLFIPPEDIAPGMLCHANGSSFCEWKGTAVYWDVVIGDLVLSRAGWSYPDPSPAFAILRNHVAFYAAPFKRCSIDGQAVIPQPGNFYGGWVTPDLAGPFKGSAGSMGW